MDAVVAFIANGEATKPVEPGERALDDPAEHAKAAAVGRAATAEDRNNAACGEAITMWLRIVATVALQDVGPSARPPAASANGDGASEATARDAPTAHRPREAVPCATVPSRPRKYKRSVRGLKRALKNREMPFSVFLVVSSKLLVLSCSSPGNRVRCSTK